MKCINCIDQDKFLIPTLHQLHPETHPLTPATKPYRFSWETKSYKPCCIIAEPLLIRACSERILAIPQQWIAVLVEGSLQQHSAHWIQNLGCFCIICTNCWCESLYLFTLMLFLVWPAAMLNFFLVTVTWKRHLQTRAYVCAHRHAHVHACMHQGCILFTGCFPSLHLSQTTQIWQ